MHSKFSFHEIAPKAAWRPSIPICKNRSFLQDMAQSIPSKKHYLMPFYPQNTQAPCGLKHWVIEIELAFILSNVLPWASTSSKYLYCFSSGAVSEVFNLRHHIYHAESTDAPWPKLSFSSTYHTYIAELPAQQAHWTQHLPCPEADPACDCSSISLHPPSVAVPCTDFPKSPWTSSSLSFKKSSQRIFLLQEARLKPFICTFLTSLPSRVELLLCSLSSSFDPHTSLGLIPTPVLAGLSLPTWEMHF